MIVSHKHQFIFLKTKKTAGTSIEIALSQFCGAKDIITPITGEDERLRRELGFPGPQNYRISLASYRLSDWSYLIKCRKRKEFYHHYPASLLKQYVGERVWRDYFVFCFERNPYDKAISRYFWSTRREKAPDIIDFLHSAPRRQLSNWSIYTINDEIAVDFVGRYECLTADLEAIWQKIGLPLPPVLTRAKGSYRQDKRHYSQVLTTEARGYIEKVCAREIDAFDYRFETVSNPQ
ncbi:MAG: chondroitin 4-O-sulfotransferase [Chloroflexaceae bacterium]|nr:chondroitin 4-O-sulfotransferase [Chloroflexaceae bacterium]